MTTPTDREWRTLLGQLETPAVGQVAEALADARDVDVGAAFDTVEAAIAEGLLVEEDTGGKFPAVTIAEEAKTAEMPKSAANQGRGGRSSGHEPQGKRGETGSAPDVNRWGELDLSTEPDTYPPELHERRQWMGQLAGEKIPFAPWGEADHADGEADKDARYKWGISDMWREGDAVAIAEDDHRLDGRVFLQQDDDPYAFVDGDDVRDPETGEIHPAFVAILEHLGVTYADVSTSGGGVHAYYRGDLPDGLPEAKWAIDTEPWGGHSDTPAIEIYANTHVNVTTGDHLVGTGTQVRPWDDEALRAILDANDQLPERRPSTRREEVDLAGYTPTATTSEETTDDIRDLFTALDRLNPKRVGEATIVREWTQGRRSFLPTWGTSDDGGTANYINDKIWHDTGDAGGWGGPVVMSAIDAGIVSHTARPADVRGGEWFEAVDHLRDLGFSIPVLVDSPETEAGRDLLGLDVVVEPANALAAAAAVTPEDLDRDLPELDREDVEDVAIAVALAEGWINTPETWPDDGRYTAAYYLARDRYGAPLPKYLDNSTLEERTTLVFAALDRVRPRHILDTLESEITVEDPHGAGTAKINPTWEDSESGERIVAGYGRGFWCAEHSPDRPDGSRTFDPLQVVALEAGLVEDEFTRPTGGAFKESYRLLREEYGAPLPRWRATLLETVPVLPPAVRLLDDVSATEADVETLGDARRRTEALVREAVDETKYAQLLTCLPGTGKTYGAIATAADRPMLYVTGRNELKKQAETYAATIRDDVEAHPDAQPSVAHLPVLSETRLPEDAVREGLDAVREGGFDLLREGAAALWDRVAPHLDAEPDEEDEETVDLARGTCETAEGDHGDRWRVRVMLANALGLRPADIHRADRALFGEALPCQTDADGEACECGLTEAWDRIRDPDRPLDLLVGSPQHAHVDSATTHYSRDADGDRVERPRAVVIDEFPEEAFFASYGGRYMDHATWLAEALVDVDTREDLLAADLSGDAWVDLWLDGEGGEYALAGDAIAALSAAGDLVEAVETAETILDDGRLDAAAQAMADTEDDNATLLDHWDDWRPLRETLAAVADASPDEDVTAAVDVLDMAEDALRTEAGRAYAETKQDDTDGEDRVDAAAVMYRLADDLETVLDGLNPALDLVDGGEAGLVETVAHRVDALPVGGDLRGLLDAAVQAIRGDLPDGLLDAATTVLRGGRDGCRELALFARGGYAHPDAWAHLAGAIADTEDDDVREVVAEAFSFDPEVEGGRYKRLTRNGAQLLADKNHHGEVVVDPPAFCDATGSTCPVVGLDATGRSALWRVAIGRDTHRLDIHDTDAERRRFLADTVDLSVVQTAETPLPYHGDPTTKNFTEDVALVEEVAAKYTGDADAALDTKGPAVMSTQKVLGAIAEELAPHAGATVEYESMKGSDALGDRQVAVLLGSQHYGDGAPEMWGLVAGESPGRDGTKGSGLDYGTDVANAFLRYMREDHVMQGILRAGRNDETTVVFAHTSALRDDLPVDARGALVSAHSKGTLQVVEAAAAFGGRFTAPDVADAIASDGVGLRQVQNVLSELRESGYVQVRETGDRGRAYGYGEVEDPGKAEVSLPEVATGENEIPTMNSYSWDFVLGDPEAARGGPPPAERPTIPASTAATPAASGAGPPG